MTTKEWFDEGLTILREGDRLFVRTLKWLFWPIEGAARWSVRTVEHVRAVVSGITAATLIAALQYARDNIEQLHLPPEKVVRVSAVIGAAMFFLHIFVQLFQEKSDKDANNA